MVPASWTSPTMLVPASWYPWFLVISLLTIIGCATPGAQKPVTVRPAEAAATARLETARRDPAALRDFFRRMPKGGDLHIHTSGAAYPADLFRLASEQGLCVNPVSGDLTSPPCGPAKDGHTLLVSQAVGGQEMKERLIDLWSVRNLPAGTKAAHDHLITIFGKTCLATEEVPVILADLRERAARDNVQYLEVIFRIRSADKKAVAIGSDCGWDEDLVRLRERCLAAGIADLTKEVSAGIVSRHEESLKRLHCGSAEARPGCGITTRYQQYANRMLPKEAVFAQLVLAFEVAKMNPLVAGVNIVGPGEDLTALRDYPLHMKMLQVLHTLTPEVRIAIHAGELKPELVAAEVLRSPIREALRTGHADRIAHAAAMRHEAASEETLREMADRRIAVEVMPTSNQFVLNLDGSTHPFPAFFEKGIPVVLATDAPGILLTDLANEFAVMAVRYPYLTWTDFKAFARNSLEFSFLEGKSLWHARGDYREPAEPCRGVEAGGVIPSPACTDFRKANLKAALQWELEEKLTAFENKK